MEQDSRKRDFLFILAKFLRSEFPETAEAFIDACDKRDLLPRSLFSDAPQHFRDLDKFSLSGIPDSQLMDIIASQKDFVSVLNRPTEIRMKNPVSISDSLIHDLGTPLPPLGGYKPRMRIVGHEKDSYCLEVDHTSQILLSGADDGIVKFWWLPDLILLKTVVAHKKPVSDISIHPSNKYVASSSYDCTCCVIEMATGCIISTFVAIEALNTCGFSPCGRWMAVAGEDGCLRIWTFENAISGGEPLQIVRVGRTPITRASFSCGGGLIVFSVQPDRIGMFAVGGSWSPVYVHCDMGTPEVVFFSKKSCRTVYGLSIKGVDPTMTDKERKRRGRSIIHRRVAVNGAWESVMNFLPRADLGLGARLLLVSACVNADESKLIAVSGTSLFVWSTFTGEELYVRTDQYTYRCIVLEPHPWLENIVFIGTKTGIGALWDVCSGTMIDVLRDSGPRFTQATWSRDGQYIVIADVVGGIGIFTYWTGSVGRTVSVAETTARNVRRPDKCSLGEIRFNVAQKDIPQDVRRDEKAMIKFVSMLKTKGAPRAVMRPKSAVLLNVESESSNGSGRSSSMGMQNLERETRQPTTPNTSYELPSFAVESLRTARADTPSPAPMRISIPTFNSAQSNIHVPVTAPAPAPVTAHEPESSIRTVDSDNRILMQRVASANDADNESDDAEILDSHDVSPASRPRGRPMQLRRISMNIMSSDNRQNRSHDNSNGDDDG